MISNLINAKCIFLFLLFCNSLISQAPPFIRSISPLINSSEKTVTITGINFPASSSNVNVSFGGVKGKIISSTNTQIISTVPSGALYRPISITTNGLTGYYPFPFHLTYPNGGYITSSSFRKKIELPTKELPKDIVVGDLNDDGLHEIVVSNSKSNTITVFVNSGKLLFTEKFDLPTGISPQGIVIADIDADGRNDILVANQGSNTISIFKNILMYGQLAAESFSPKYDLSVDERPNSIEVYDLERDGRNDIIVSNENGNTISVLRGITATQNAPLNFSKKISLTTQLRPRSVSIGDIDRDGRADIFCVNEFSNSISIFRNISKRDSLTTRSFAQRVDLLVGSKPKSIALADINNDRRLDLIIAHSDEDYFSIIRNKSKPDTITVNTFEKQTDYPTSGAQDDIVAADFDGDGRCDIGIVTGSNFLSLHKNSGEFSSNNLKSYINFTTGSGPIALTVGDLDGDAHPEILTINKGSNTISVFQNRIGPPVITSMSPAIVTTGGTVLINGWHLSAVKKVFFGNIPAVNVTAINDSLVAAIIGKGESGIVKLETPGGSAIMDGIQYIPKPTIYNIEPEVGVPGTEIKITGLNFNPDKNKNLIRFGTMQAEIISASSEEMRVIVPFGGTYEPISITVDGVTVKSVKPFAITYSGMGISKSYFEANINKPTLKIPVKIQLGDFDMNGRLDLLTLNDGSDSLSLYYNSKNAESIIYGTFEDPIHIATPIKGEDFVVCDINGDEQLDVAMSHYTTNSISIFRSKPRPKIIAFNFQPLVDRIELKTGLYPRAVAVGDIDGDGKMDIAVTNYGSYNISIFRNIGSGSGLSKNTFSEKIDIPAGNKPWGIAIADIDGDKKNDLVVANSGANTLSLYRNIGNIGTFTTSSFDLPIELPTGMTPTNLAIADFNNDLLNDIVVVNSNERSISVFPNQNKIGSITTDAFSESFKVNVSLSPTSLAINDIDGDGLCDIGVISASGNIALLQNFIKKNKFSDDSFISKAQISSNESLSNIAIADIDNDGRNDIILACDSTNNFKVYYNNIPPYIPLDTAGIAKPLGVNTFYFKNHFSVLSAYHLSKSLRILGGLSFKPRVGVAGGFKYLIKALSLNNLTPYLGLVGGINYKYVSLVGGITSKKEEESKINGFISFPIGIEFQNEKGVSIMIGTPLQLHPDLNYGFMLNIGYYF